MNKRYLSSNERKQLITTASALKSLETTIDELASRDREKHLLKDLRTARTFLDRAITAWMMVMPNQEMDAMIKQARNYQLTLTLKSEAKAERQKALQDASNIAVEASDFLALVDSAKQGCYGCDGSYADGCLLRKVMLKHEIPPHQVKDATKCLYAYCVLTEEDTAKEKL